MGSDLQLTGLASGFDWAPVVDQLIELERIPVQRLEREKKENEEKMSDLGLLKTQLDTLNTAAGKLQNDDLWDSRKVAFTSGSASASASSGSITGEFSVEVVAKGSRTTINSKNRTFSGLGKPIGIADDTFDNGLKVSDLPLQTKITTGTFTISGKTFSINSLNSELQDVLDMINLSSPEGVNPEETDGNGYTLNYDHSEDKFFFAMDGVKVSLGNAPILGSPTDTSNFLAALKLNNPEFQSSQPLGAISMTDTLENANFRAPFQDLNAGKLGTFFIGEGQGVVRIDYDITVDTVATLVQKVNSSKANVFMFYDPVSDRFIMRNNESGATGITLHESSDWDELSSNKGSGNVLELMGFAPPKSISTAYIEGSAVSVSQGDYFQYSKDGNVTYWQALENGIIGDPALDNNNWRQVIEGVSRSMKQEVGTNSSVRVNGGELVYSNGLSFSDDEHGYEGINFNIENVSIGKSFAFSVSKDTSKAKEAIDKFVEEFNDAQDYIKSLVSVQNDGENVTAGRFSSNIEMSRLGSQLRKVVFGESTPHSESKTTRDGANFILSTQSMNSLVSINSDPASELLTLKADLSLNSSSNGYLVRVLSDNLLDSDGNEQTYYRFNGSSGDWELTDPTFSSFRLSDIGLDFGVGSDNIKVKNSAMLINMLDEDPDMVKYLFDQDKISRFDNITKSDRYFQGMTQAVDEFVSTFLDGNLTTGYNGTYTTHIESIKGQNKRIDSKIEEMEKYLEQREKTLSDGFMKMEEMQSKLNTQLQTLQSSFSSNKK